MEHRYADESEPSWYTGRRYAADPETSGSHSLADSPYDSGVRNRSVPEQRDREALSIPIRGPEYPPVRPASATPAAEPPPMQGPAPAPISTPAPISAPAPVSTAGPASTPAPAIAEPTALVPPVAARSADGVYRTRRPISSVVLTAVAAVLLLPALRLLLTVTFASDPDARGIVPAVLLTLGLPLTAIGLFAAGGGAPSRDAWLRAPLAYLPGGLILLLAAGLAVA
ncbi:hypothetical protein AB0F72_25105 [Actinoplanes sp. NPDC023936]|uniref:hypothetical protein n=1 Tax=Actinoplanes sp. NPDC023936 TaxID=3154910 RepID=UPI00340DA7A6